MRKLSIFVIVVLMALPIQAIATGPVVTHDCDISWVAPTQDTNGNPTTVTGYNVYWGISPGVYGTPVAISATSTTCSAVGITANGQYYLTVSALNSAGEGPKAVEVPFVLSVVSVPEAPSSLQVN